MTLRAWIVPALLMMVLAGGVRAAEELDENGRPVIPPAPNAAVGSVVPAAGATNSSVGAGSSVAPGSTPALTDARDMIGADGAPLRIAVVDLDRITRDSARIRGRIGEIEQRLEGYSAEVEALEAEIDRQRLELVRRRTLMIPEEVERREREIRLAEERVESIRFRARRLTSRLEAEVVEPSLREIVQVTRDFATDGGFDLVLRRDLVLFASPRADLTDAIMARLDAMGPAEPVFLPEESAASAAASSASTAAGLP